MVKKTALGETPSSVSVWPCSLAPRAFTTISDEECFRVDGVPIVFWAGAVMALEVVEGAGIWANASPGASNAATIKPESN